MSKSNQCKLNYCKGYSERTLSKTYDCDVTKGSPSDMHLRKIMVYFERITQDCKGFS